MRSGSGRSRDVIARGAFTSVADLARKLMKYMYAKSAKHSDGPAPIPAVTFQELNDRDGPLV